LKKAFTLIEVLISTFIVMIAVTAILGSVSNTKHFFNLITQNKFFTLSSSVIFLEQKHRKNLYEDLIDFNISNDEIIEDLKKEKIKFKIYKDFSEDFNQTDGNFTFSINKIKAYNDQHSNFVYEIGIK